MEEYLGYTFIVAIMIAMIILYFNFNVTIPPEGFKNVGDIIVKRDNEIYDDFYVSVYDELLHDEMRTNWEVGYVINHMSGDDNYILDVGSGTGNTVDIFTQIGINAVGIDKSKAMTKHSLEQFPNSKFITSDITHTMIFEPETFSVITCLYFTIYYVKDKRMLFENCMKYLRPGGILVLHLVDRNKFDTLLPDSNPLLLISPQNYTKQRITRSVGKFENHDYMSDFIFNNENVVFYETFTNIKTGEIRKHELQLYMETQREILKIARSAGFILESQTEMDNCQHTSQYLYVLQKPR
jgi:SAM-dependent methyltransferase